MRIYAPDLADKPIESFTVADGKRLSAILPHVGSRAKDFAIAMECYMSICSTMAKTLPRPWSSAAR
jgi:hypothetical protein